MTLTDFLLARIAEDEAVIREPQFVALAEPIDRGQLLAECEARRRIVELEWHRFGEYGWGMEEAKRQILTHLAAVYAEHPDYDGEWAL